jgi:hypothetical protein
MIEGGVERDFWLGREHWKNEIQRFAGAGCRRTKDKIRPVAARSEPTADERGLTAPAGIERAVMIGLVGG